MEGPRRSDAFLQARLLGVSANRRVDSIKANAIIANREPLSGTGSIIILLIRVTTIYYYYYS